MPVAGCYLGAGGRHVRGEDSTERITMDGTERGRRNSMVRDGVARARLGRGELLLILAFWLLMATLSAIGVSLDPRGRFLQPGPFPGHIVMPFIQYSFWAALTPLIFVLVSRLGIDRPYRFGKILLLLAIGLVIAILADALSTYLRFELVGPLLRPRRGGRLMRGIFFGFRRFWFLDDFALYLAVLGAGLARDYSLRLRARYEETVRLQAEAARLSAQLAEARLAALRTQLDPHFLFNTLNAVSALVERDPKGVRRMIARLSELLRRSLEGAATPETPLQRELDFISRYLEIMQIRFQGDLAVEVRVEPDTLDALVPTLVLQPLVENAIKHGIAEGEYGGRIEIVARREGEVVVLQVLDDGRGAPEPIVEGLGLRNTRERLEALYGTAYRLEVARRPDRGTRAEIRLPYHTAEDLHTLAATLEE